MAKAQGYIRHRAPFVAMYAISMLCVIGIAFFAGEDMSVALYTALIISFFFACIAVVDIDRYAKKLKTLDELCGTITHLSRALPRGEGGLEKAYAHVLEELCNEYDALSASETARKQESLDYYTLWIHQIKTPIAAMRLLLEQELGRFEQRLAVVAEGDRAVMRQELFKIEQYAMMALRFIKLESISSDIVLAPCRLDSAVKEQVRSHSIPFVYKGLSVSVNVSGQSIMTDKKWLGFIIEQLISNAVKYTNKGGVTICGDAKTLSIEDTGIGIMPEDLPRIFEKGYTGYNGRIDDRSSGIGLYMAKRAADALSIRIGVESRLGKGTRFTLYFPDCEREIYK